MIIKNAKVFNENGSFEERDIYMEGERFTSETTDEIVIDAA